MMKHLNEPVPDLAQLLSGVPQELKAIIDKSLAKQREYRFGSAKEMVKALEKVLFLLESGAPYGTAHVQTVPTHATSSPAQISAPRASIHVSAPQPAPAPARQTGIRPAYLYGGGAALLVLLVACVLAAVFIIPRMLPENANAASGSVAQKTDVVVLVVTDTPSSPPTTISEASATPTAEPTATTGPTATATPAVAPTATIPPGIPFVRINKIEVDDQNRYVVEYETAEYTEQLPGVHIHFFFNTVPPDQAGTPGKGPWILYGGPRPFTGYKTSDRPAEASQLCALVANANHSVQPDSGTCYPLPDVPTITARSEAACYAGPGEMYASTGLFKAGATALLTGLSIDALWLYVQNPDQLDSTCWIPTVSTFIQGDISQLSLVEAPPTPIANTMVVEITGVTKDSSGLLVVAFLVRNFEPSIPGIHIHFYFDTTPADQIGIGSSGSRKMYGGSSPFSGFTVAEIPAGATQICAIVANADHSVITNSGNCFALP